MMVNFTDSIYHHIQVITEILHEDFIDDADYMNNTLKAAIPRVHCKDTFHYLIISFSIHKALSCDINMITYIC